MFELRWLERKTGERGMNEWGYYYDKTERILQVRHRMRVTDYSVVEQVETHRAHTWVWGEWTDIPVIEEVNGK